MATEGNTAAYPKHAPPRYPANTVVEFYSAELGDWVRAIVQPDGNKHKVSGWFLRLISVDGALTVTVSEKEIRYPNA